MAHSEPGPGRGSEVVQPAVPTARSPRNGYLLLAVSGVVLATAFGGIAQLVAPAKTASGTTGGNEGPGSQQIAPYTTVPGSDSTTEDSSSSATGSSSTPTVSVGPDGKGTVTLGPSSGSSKSVEPPPGSSAPPRTSTGGPGATSTTRPTPPPSSSSSTPTTTSTRPTTTTSPSTVTPSTA